MKLLRNDINTVALAIQKFQSETVSFNNGEAHDRNNFSIKFADSGEKFAVNGLQFITVISKCIGDIEFIVNEKLIIKNNNSRFSIPLVEYEDNSFINDIPSETIPVRLSYLDYLCSAVGFACSKNIAKPVLNGINLVLDNCNLRATGLDGARMSEAIHNIICDSNAKFNLTIPSKDIVGSFKLFKDVELKLSYNGSSLFLCDKSTKIRLSVIAGEYPEVSKLKPKVYLTSIELNKEELVSALQKCDILNERKNIADVVIDNNKITFTTNAVESTLYCEVEGEKHLDISFNTQYLLDALQVVNGEKVKINFQGTLKPFYIQNINTFELLTPVRR